MAVEITGIKNKFGTNKNLAIYITIVISIALSLLVLLLSIMFKNKDDTSGGVKFVALIIGLLLICILIVSIFISTDIGYNISKGNTSYDIINIKKINSNENINSNGLFIIYKDKNYEEYSDESNDFYLSYNVGDSDTDDSTIDLISLTEIINYFKINPYKNYIIGHVNVYKKKGKSNLNLNVSLNNHIIDIDTPEEGGVIPVDQPDTSFSLNMKINTSGNSSSYYKLAAPLKKDGKFINWPYTSRDSNKILYKLN